MEISHIAARRFCADVFGSYGFTRRESESIADALLRADLYGIESHGIQRLARYHEEIAGGAVDVRARPETVFETKISAVVDAHKAMGRALEMAGEHGVGMVAVRNSNHYGIAGYYTRMASERDFMGICMTNTEAICVPTFGKQAMLGTNPIAVSLPAEPFDFTFDSATTVVPRGKLEVYKKNEAPLPDGWALDSEGRPSGDAAEVLGNIIGKLGGGIAPLGGLGETLGGHKGYGLAAIVDIFTGIFSGGATSDAVNTLPGRTDICHYFAAVDYGLFGDKKAIKDRLSQFLAGLRASRKAAGQGRIYTHGEKEAELMAARANAAFPVNGKTWEEMRAIAEAQGLDFAAYFKEGRAWQA
ncbi:MAG: Ldh family oxidoreductase [Clostridiales bacterium]|jgi:LDH2 family malate/lactate/ureidoglycolate dehydrogenase|nr:Ldh family oxidoreductase [Clostridiales bacterium]